MLLSRRLLDAMASHAWQKSDEGKRCSACGLLLPADEASVSYGISQLPTCPGAADDEHDDGNAEKPEPADG